MKKLLALVLALVMTLSLCITSNAAFAGEEYDYDEAVEVMAAVGVFQGDENGKFNGKAELTREQAAKLIAYLDLGEKVAEALPAVKVFNDVEANRWSAKYVAYCADAGYLAGVGDNNFDPAGKLTGYAFGKMLLCALGYDAEIEQFTGTNWSIKVATLMQENNIAKGVSSNASATLTREEAAQYCFNALKATCVKYDNNTVITVGDVEIKQTTKAKPVTGGDYCAVYGGVGDTTVQLLEKLYKDDLVKGTEGTDDFGRPAATWTYDTKKVGTYGSDTPVLTYTERVKEKDVFTALGADGIKGSSAKYVVMDEIWEDGVLVAKGKAHTGYTNWHEADTSLATRRAEYDESVVIAKAFDSYLVGAGNGVTVEFYAVDDAPNHYTMVVIHQYLTKVTGVTKANATNGKDRYVTTALGNFETEDFAKKDMVLVTIADGEIQSMKLAEKVENVPVSSYTSSSVTADGTTYKYSQECSSFKSTAYSMVAGDTYTFYLDSNGYIIDGEGYSVSNTDYFFVKAVNTPAQETFAEADEFTAKYQLVGMDGKVVTVKQMEADNSNDVSANTIVTYKDDEDYEGYVKITPVDAYDSDDKSTAGFLNSSAVTSFSKTAASVAGLSFNNNTVFVLKTGTSTYKVVNGLSAMDNWSSLASQTIYTVTKNGVATVAFLDCSAGTAQSTADDLVYVISTSYTTSYDSDLKKTIHTYKTVDGTVSALSTGTALNAEGLWNITGTEGGYVKTASQITTTGKYVVDAALASTAGEVKYEEGVLTIGSTSYVVASDVAVTLVDGDDNVTADAGVEALVSDTVKGTFTLIKADATSNDTIKTIYFNGTID